MIFAPASNSFLPVERTRGHESLDFGGTDLAAGRSWQTEDRADREAPAPWIWGSAA